MRTETTKQLTLRLPAGLYRTAKRLAMRRGVSINKLAQEGIERLADQEMAVKMRVAYEDLSADHDSNVERFLPAQAEVIDRG